MYVWNHFWADLLLYFFSLLRSGYCLAVNHFHANKQIDYKLNWVVWSNWIQNRKHLHFALSRSSSCISSGFSFFVYLFDAIRSSLCMKFVSARFSFNANYTCTNKSLSRRDLFAFRRCFRCVCVSVFVGSIHSVCYAFEYKRRLKIVCSGWCRESKTKVIKSRTFPSFNAQSFVLCLFNWISLPNKWNQRRHLATSSQDDIVSISVQMPNTCIHYEYNRFSVVLTNFQLFHSFWNSPDGNPSNFQYCVLQKTLHLRTLKSWETHSEPEKQNGREYNITIVIFIKVNFIMVFVSFAEKI